MSAELAGVQRLRMSSSRLGHPEAGGAPASLVSEDVRRHNLSLVLRYLVNAGPSARSDIAMGTGLTRGSMTALVGALVEAGVVRELRTVSAGRGRRRSLLGLAADSLALVVAQLDADHATAVAFDLSGESLARHREQHGRPMGDPEAVVDVLARVLGRTLAEVGSLGRRVADMTVIVFAPVGGVPPVVLADTDLRWGLVDVVALLRRRLPELPEVRLVADAVVAASAEHRLLPRASDVVYVKSNSGIGGAVITAGRLVEGAHGLAGALGHIPIDHPGLLCECGQRGCLVTVAGPDVVLEAAGLGEELRTVGLTATLAIFSERVLAGAALETHVWLDAAEWIARALQIVTMAVDPQAIVVGGYWSALTASIETAFRTNRPSLAGDDAPAVVAGQLGEDAAILGALWSARDRLLQDPMGLAD